MYVCLCMLQCMELLCCLTVFSELASKTLPRLALASISKQVIVHPGNMYLFKYLNRFCLTHRLPVLQSNHVKVLCVKNALGIISQWNLVLVVFCTGL